MRAYERLLNYVKVYTTSDPVSDTHPTTARQFDLARMLVKELQDLGLADAHVDEHCYVYATLPATPGHEAAKGLGFIAHMDTSPDAPGENVKPQIHENYDGGDVVLPGTGAVLSTKQFGRQSRCGRDYDHAGDPAERKPPPRQDLRGLYPR